MTDRPTRATVVFDFAETERVLALVEAVNEATRVLQSFGLDFDWHWEQRPQRSLWRRIRSRTVQSKPN